MSVKRWPAQRSSQSISWSGVQVTGVRLRVEEKEEELSEEIPDEFDSPQANVLQLLPIETLQEQFPHNANLQQQFASLAASFQAWRPIRGDGNCYYRAVLFAWLEHCFAQGLQRPLQALLEKLGNGKEAQLCQNRLKAWLLQRQKCTDDAGVQSILERLTAEFNRKDVDYAFVYCLRQLVAQYVRLHAKDSIDGSLTLESWAFATGATNIDEYCEQHICSMQKDAADHVQWVCPRVLETIVRICMVDRETARCTFIDYGQAKPGPPPYVGATSVPTAAELTVGGSPEIFLLLKPGHYDILVPRRKLRPRPHKLEKTQDVGELCAGFRAVMRCLEEKLVHELLEHRRDWKELDHFQGQLTSVLEPLYHMMQVPSQPEMSAMRALLPCLDDFLQNTRPQQVDAPRPKHAVRNSRERSEPKPGLCCVCIKNEAEITAKCGCSYHRRCLEEYAHASTSWSQLACKLHRRIFGHDFLISHLGDAMAASLLPQPSPRRPQSQQMQSGHLGVALGVPCVICFGEDGVLKTLHCGFKAHLHCLKDFWFQKVSTLCRITDIRCPAEVAGCASVLLESDLRGVITREDLQLAEQTVREVDERNQRLIEELKRQSEEYRPTFRCAICLVDHEVEGCCTLPCQHRFCFESLQYHFDLIVRERRLSKLTCPAEGCGYNLRSEDSIHIFQQCLPEESYYKLLEFLTRDDPHIVDCRALGCEERVFCDEGDDYADLACPKGHRFCAKCDNGPHPSLSCAARRSQLEQEKCEVWSQVLSMGWKPCPRKCRYGGGYKAQEECDHVTCECGHQFCWDCGIDRRIPLAHDNRWHKPSCRYYTRLEEVAELPKFEASCPACRRSGDSKEPCHFPDDDGYPHSYLN
ncbi:unnamed protein product [Durusdinium trenchii]|uniref:ubiquitinyl hydrolase 1 n=1 Tax=Durusdinium trenchii TaxID=1381693 RepID=A0ABP0NXF7_9DINO